MRKKYLSALLFGALLFASAGTFTSCKDYDDDISNLQEQITANADAIKALQDLVGNGQFVTGVSGTGNQITFTFSNGGQSQTVTVEAGSGQEAQTVTISEEGELLINGEGTGIFASQEVAPETGLVKQQEGTWWVLGEDGEYTNTNIPVSGVTVSGTEAEGYTLTIVDANGESTVVELPSPASAITQIELREFVSDYKTASADELFIYDQQFNFSSHTPDIKSASAWKGTKALPANKSVIYSTSALGLQINPTTVDATLVSQFVLTNSQNQSLSGITLKASEYNNLLTRGTNGLYSLSMENTVLSENESKVLNDELGAWERYAKFAVNVNSDVRSEYNVTVVKALPQSLTQLYVDGLSSGLVNINTTGNYLAEVKVGQTYTIEGVQASALYDLYCVVDQTTKAAYGVEIDNANHTFTVTKNPDTSTTRVSFPMTIYTAANNGDVYKTVVEVVLSAEIPSASEYAEITTDVSTKDNFSFDLATMKEGLGSLQTWMLNVNLSNVQYALYETYENDQLSDEVTNAFTSGLFTAKVVASDGKTVTSDANKATDIKVEIDNTYANIVGMELDKTYYLQVTYLDKNGAGVLNTSIVPVKFTAPALADLFVIKDGYTDADDNVINAYFYDETGSTAVQLNKYFEKYVKLNDAVEYQSGNVDDTNKPASALFTTITTTDFDYIKVDLQDKFNSTKGEVPAGYGKAVTINVTKDNFEGWKYTTEGDDKYSFQIRLMSPIYEGTVAPAEGNSIVINGNELKNGFNITSDMIIGADYNGNKYNVVPDKVVNGVAARTIDGISVEANVAWAEPQIEYAVPQFDKNKYIKELKVTKATSSKNKVTNGTFNLKGESISQDVTFDMPVKVKDIWGYELTVNVPVTITRTAE